MGLKSILKIASTVAGQAVGVDTADIRIALALERIAAACERAYPKREPLRNEKGQVYLPLGITHSDNETLVEREREEEAEVKSREEKILKEVREFNEWKERQNK